MKFAQTCVLILIVLLCMSMFQFLRLAHAQPTTIIVPDDYPTIQGAINAASDGDTIFVRNGTYDASGPINITKSLTLEGENKYGTIINAGGGMNGGVSILADNVGMYDFTIQNGGYVGIGAVPPIGPEGGYVNFTFSNNIMMNNFQGIRLVITSGDVVSNNIINGNSAGAIGFDYVNDSIIRNNTITNSGYALSLSLPNYNNAILENNIIGNTYGIVMNNLLTGNRFYHNNIINNTEQVYTYYIFQGVNDTWDNGYPSGGNYWSDYNGTDSFRGPFQNLTGSDGIGDTPYVIDANNTDRYPLMNPWSPHDVAVTNVLSSKTIVGQGYSLAMNVTVVNLGDFAESFNLTSGAINALSGVHTIEGIETETSVSGLLPNETRLVALEWNTSGLAYTNYTVWASASTVPGETNTANNNCTAGWVIVSIPGDITGPNGLPDGKVDMRDIGAVARFFGVSYPDPRYNPNYDINGDGKIDMRDIGIAARNFGQQIPLQ